MTLEETVLNDFDRLLDKQIECWRRKPPLEQVDEDVDKTKPKHSSLLYEILQLKPLNRSDFNDQT